MQEAKTKQEEIDIVRLKQADDESKLSKCVKHAVGCLITDSLGRIVSTGYNGTPSGSKNCCEHFPDFDATYLNDCHNHHQWSTVNEIHAEVNAVMYSSPEKRLGGTLYVNLQPCSVCAKIIAGCGVARVVYGKKYHRTDDEATKLLFSEACVQYIHLPNVLGE